MNKVLKTAGVWNTKNHRRNRHRRRSFGVLMNYGEFDLHQHQTDNSNDRSCYSGFYVRSCTGFISCSVGNVIADLIGGWGLC